MTSKAWLSLGANLGDPPAQLAEAIRRIAAHPAIHVGRQSSVLATKPWGKTDQPDFANQAAKLDDYATLDLALRYEPEFLKGLRLIGGVDNVFDKEYAYCGFYGSSYYPANGRTWKLCAAYTF